MITRYLVAQNYTLVLLFNHTLLNSMNLSNFLTGFVIAILLVSSTVFSHSYAGVSPPDGGKYYDKIIALNALVEKPPPRQQLADGIRYEDVVCSNDLVLMLKWSENSVACIKSKTVEKLIERGWGIPFQSTALIPGDCFNSFVIYYNESNMHKKSNIIKTIRTSLSQVDLNPIWGDYEYRWEHIEISGNPNNENSFSVTVDGGYDLDSEEFKKINEALYNIKGITNVESHHSPSCK